MSIDSLLDAIVAQDYTEASKIFDGEVKSRIGDSLEAAKVSIGAQIYSNEEEESPEE